MYGGTVSGNAERETQWFKGRRLTPTSESFLQVLTHILSVDCRPNVTNFIPHCSTLVRSRSRHLYPSLVTASTGHDFPTNRFFFIWLSSTTELQPSYSQPTRYAAWIIILFLHGQPCTDPGVVKLAILFPMTMWHGLDEKVCSSHLVVCWHRPTSTAERSSITHL